MRNGARSRNVTEDEIHQYVVRKQREVRRMMKQYLEDRDESTVPGFYQLFDAVMNAYEFMESSWNSGRPVKIPKWQRDLRKSVTDVLRQFRTPSEEDERKSRNIRILSPRIFGISRQNPNEQRLLSPDLLSLSEDNEDSDSKIVPLKSKGDRRSLTELALEVSGASDVLMAMKEIIPEANSNFEVYLKFAKSMVDFFYRKSMFRSQLYDLHRFFKLLDKTYTSKQRRDLLSKGYTFMNRKQNEMVYGPNNPLNIRNVPSDYEYLSRLSEKERDIELIKMARHYAEEGLPSQKRRRKRENAQDAIVFEYELEPTNRGKRAIFRPLILSPVVLSATILDPVLMGPIILSPLVLFPVVLSPLVLGIETVNAQVMAPVILSPLLLFPIVVSPRVLNPFVLSPLTLSPAILLPATLEPLILTPFVLSPIILSPQDRSALILSPLVYSPLIRTRLTNYVVIISPAVVARKRRNASMLSVI
ncbi:unnamed protein product [Soboliphyme baturini]|uniref:Uncharacterized protein n=1 Tax=Soboliphyme baturini TaxID=241478 RepID=A0A183IZQ0_9BILA|nr:unnamed protein product [Soboliphyme baturini]